MVTNSISTHQAQANSPLKQTSTIAATCEQSLLFSSQNQTKVEPDFELSVAECDECDRAERLIHNREDNEGAPTLSYILEVPVISNNSGLIDYLFPNITIGFNPELLLENLRLKANGGWTKLPDIRHWDNGPVSASKYLDLLKALSVKSLSSTASWSAPSCARRWISTGGHGIRPIADGDLGCDPTLVLVRSCYQHQQGQFEWENVMSAWIYKPSEIFRGDAERECVEFADALFYAQPFRNFVLTVFMIEATMTVMYFDRSGGLASERVDLCEQPAIFLRVVLGMLFMDDTGLGIDSSVTSKGGKMSLDVEGESYELLRQIHGKKFIEERATICFEAKDKDGNIVLLKDYWPVTEDLCNEIEMLKLLNKPPANASQDDIQRHESSLCTPDGVRVIPKLMASSCVQSVITEVKDGTYRTIQRTCSTATIRDALGLLQTVHDKPLIREWKEAAFNRSLLVDARTRWRIVISPVGTSLNDSSAPEVEDIMLIAHDILFAIKALREKNIVHRDISDMNVVVQQHKGKARGLLIDFDAATHVSPVMDLIPERKNTLEFITLNVIDTTLNVPYTYFYDLQSLFLVLCWYCSPLECRDSTGAISRDKCVRSRWTSYDYHPSSVTSALEAKRGDVRSDEEFEENVLKHFHARFERLKAPLRKIRRLLFGPWDLSAIARALLMPVVVKEPWPKLNAIQRYVNLLHPGERSPTLVFLSMAGWLRPRNGVSYTGSAYNTLVEQARYEQYYQLFARPNACVMMEMVEKKRKERLSLVRDKSEGNLTGDCSDPFRNLDEDDMQDPDDGSWVNDYESVFEELRAGFDENVMESAKARVVEAFATVQKEHPEVFTSTDVADVYANMRRIIETHENIPGKRGKREDDNMK